MSNVCSSDLREAAISFLGWVLSADPGHWHPAIVSVYEAHLFAPHGDNGVSRETRKASLETMRDLMCRGRKLGLSGIIATLRLSKLDKNVAAEASNYLLGRTFLDIDINRAADLQSGTAHVRTPVPNALRVCRLLLYKKNKTAYDS